MVTLTLFQPGFFGLSMTGGLLFWTFCDWGDGLHPPSENNVIVELRQLNLEQLFTSIKTTPVPNLIVIAQSMPSL